MDITRIREFLNRADGVSAWQLRRSTREAMTVIRLPGIYSLADGRLRREPNPYPREVITAPSENVQVVVYSEFEADGGNWRGNALGQLTSNDPAAVKPVIDSLVAGARSQKNNPYPLPDSGEQYPEVELADRDLIDLDGAELLDRAQRFNDAVVDAARDVPGIDISNLELFIRRSQVEVETSSGISLAYPATRVDAELCFLARPDEGRFGEMTARLSARRMRDLVPAAIVAEYGGMARDIALAGPPQAW